MPTLKKNIHSLRPVSRKTSRWISQRFTILVLLPFIGFLSFTQARQIQATLTKQHEPLSRAEQDRVAFAVGQVLAASTLTTHPEDSHFTEIVKPAQPVSEAAAGPTYSAPNENKDLLTRYTVRPGDTLSGIAARYNLHSISITLLNNLKNSQSIAVGQTLLIPSQDADPEKMSQAQDEQEHFLRTLGTVASDTSTTQSQQSKTTGINLVHPSRHIVQMITQYFSSYHQAIDLSMPPGTPIVAAAAGTINIARTGYNGGYGTMILINHLNGYATLYAHLSQLDVEAGEQVDQGEVIGASGSTGNSTGPHLHFELRLNGTKLNPLPYVQ